MLFKISCVIRFLSRIGFYISFMRKDMFSKLLLETMEQFTLLGIRSMIAFIVLLIICFPSFKKTTKKDVVYGTVIGAAFFIVMFFELAGLKHTSSVSISFEENTAVILVPILLAILTRKFPSKKTCLIFLLSGIGIVLLCFRPDGFDFNIGDVYGMMAALTYAQSGTTAERAGVLCALSPVTAAVLGSVFLDETLTLKGFIGAVLIVTSIIL